MPLSNLFELRGGYTPSKSNENFWENGTVPWFRMEDIREHGRILTDSIQHVSEQAVKSGGLFPAGSIIMATTATIGEHALITVDSLANQQFTYLTIREPYKNLLNPKFVFYYCFILGRWCKEHTSQSSFQSVRMDEFKRFNFPVPPLAEQERIVSILDKFDALVTDLSSGLPAEIEARHKQYEYYRDKLLDFRSAE